MAKKPEMIRRGSGRHSRGGRPSESSGPSHAGDSAGEKKPHGYQGPRNDAGLTPRQQCDEYRAMLYAMTIAERKGALVERAKVVADMQQAADMIRSDLMSLPLRLRSKLAGKVFDQHEVQSIIESAVREIVEGWIQSAGIPASAASSASSSGN